jgi:hypothetical protein
MEPREGAAALTLTLPDERAARAGWEVRERFRMVFLLGIGSSPHRFALPRPPAYHLRLRESRATIKAATCELANGVVELRLGRRMEALSKTLIWRNSLPTRQMSG